MKETEVIREERQYDVAKLFFLRVQRNLVVHHSPSNSLDMVVQFQDRPDFKIGVELKSYHAKINSTNIHSFLKNITFYIETQYFNYPILIMLVDEKNEKAKIGLVTSLNKKNKLTVVENLKLEEASNLTINAILDDVIKWYKTNKRSSDNEG